MLGTAILVAIVGEPASLAAALDVSNSAYLFAAIAALASGAAALGLRRQRAAEPLGGAPLEPPFTAPARRAG